MSVVFTTNEADYWSELQDATASWNVVSLAHGISMQFVNSRPVWTKGTVPLIRPLVHHFWE